MTKVLEKNLSWHRPEFRGLAALLTATLLFDCSELKRLKLVEHELGVGSK